MANNPFQCNLWSAQLVLETFGKDSKVYPSDNIYEAFDLSESQELLRLFREHELRIDCAKEEIKRLTEGLDIQTAALQKKYDYKYASESLDVMHFLDFTSVDLVRFIEEVDPDYLCWPVADRDSLIPCFKEYHIYQFYDEYMDFIPSGIINFLRLIPKMKPLFESAQINGTFYWQNREVGFLFEFEEAVEDLMQQHVLVTAAKKLLNIGNSNENS